MTIEQITIIALRQSIVDLLERAACDKVAIDKLQCALVSIAAQNYEIPTHIARKAIAGYKVIQETPVRSR